MSAQTALFIAADLVFFAMLLLMLRIYFHGLRLAKGILYLIAAVAATSLVIFIAAMIVDGIVIWGGPTALATVLFFAALFAPSSPAVKALAPDSDQGLKNFWPSGEDETVIAAEPEKERETFEGPLDYRQFYLDRETNMFLHRPDGNQTIACYVSWLSAPGDAQLTLDDLLNRAENHVCHVARVPAVA